MTIVSRLVPLCCLALLGACGADSKPSTPPTIAAAPALQKFLLTADPGPAEHVKAAKAAGARDKITVTGRIADIVGGLAAFRIMDVAIPYCGEKNPGDTCKTPWDYCCESKTIRSENSLHVEVRGADGKPLASPSLPDLRLLDVVKVTGKLTVDEHKNQVLLADGLFRASRPEVPTDLEWPK